jgi:hypothetical protein
MMSAPREKIDDREDSGFCGEARAGSPAIT